MAIDASTIVPASVQRNLADKLYEKRKNAALEIEGITKSLAALGEHEKITALIKMLVEEFTKSPQANHRKGGLIGLAAVTVGLTTEAGPHLDVGEHLRVVWVLPKNIVPPVIDSFQDQDSRVRYYACEALYNIAKVVRGDFIVFFNKIFDALCKLSADSDANVQSAAHLLDRLVKDIVTESDSFSIEEFIPLLKERMNVLNPYVRQFLVGWITVLDSVPDIDMLGFLPDFLDGLFNMLSDMSLEIRQQADSALSEFLQEIKNSPNVDYGRMAEILVRRCCSTDAFTRLTAVIWVNEFVKLGGDQLVPHYADILGAILPCISDKEEKIRVVACETNEELRGFKPEPSEGFDVGKVLQIARRELNSEFEATRIEALRWIQSLVLKYRNEITVYMDDIFGSLLNALSDPSEDVVLLVLEVHACVAQETLHFTNLVTHLLSNFKVNNSLLEKEFAVFAVISLHYILLLYHTLPVFRIAFGKRGPLVVRRLCVLLDAERVYREFSNILGKESDLDFAATMIQALNLILVTSAELGTLRSILKGALMNSSGKELFLSLYPSWCHSAMATITLCFLAQAYQHASNVIQSLKEEDINIKFLVHLDKLIRLLETPIFSYLRLQLLEPEKHTWLVKCLYGLLMLLPQQSSAFKILRTRLKTVPSSRLSDAMTRVLPAPHDIPIKTEYGNGNPEQDAASIYKSIDFPTRLVQFVETQEKHRQFAKMKPPPTLKPDSVLDQGSGTHTDPRLSPASSFTQDDLKQEDMAPPYLALPLPDINRPPSRASTSRSFQ